jgi:hypothetical protein
MVTKQVNNLKSIDQLFFKYLLEFL